MAGRVSNYLLTRRRLSTGHGGEGKEGKEDFLFCRNTFKLSVKLVSAEPADLPAYTGSPFTSHAAHPSHTNLLTQSFYHVTPLQQEPAVDGKNSINVYISIQPSHLESVLTYVISFASNNSLRALAGPSSCS